MEGPAQAREREFSRIERGSLPVTVSHGSGAVGRSEYWGSVPVVTYQGFGVEDGDHDASQSGSLPVIVHQGSGESSQSRYVQESAQAVGWGSSARMLGEETANQGAGVVVSKGGQDICVVRLQDSGLLPSVGLRSVELSEFASPLDVSREIAVHRAVVASGRHNFEGCRIPVYSKLNIPEWRARLRGYHDQKLCDLLEFGFPVGYCSPSWPAAALVNHKGALQFPEEVDKYLVREVREGAMMGPFTENPLCVPLCVSPLNTVPKGKEERRVISDLSFPEGRSVNAGIPKGVYLGEAVKLSFPSVDAMAAMIRKKGRGCFMFKRDLSRAYRQLPIDPGDVHLLGASWGSRLFIDRSAVMGLTSAAMFCQRTTDAVVYLFSEAGFDSTNFLDDFGAAEVAALVWQAFECLASILRELGLDEKFIKAVSPSQLMEFLGVLFNSLDMTMSVTPERLQEIKELLRGWRRRRRANRRQLESLVGKLLFVAKCVRPGRLFVARMLEVLRGLEGRSSSFVVDEEFSKDVMWWSSLLEWYNGVSIIPDVLWAKPDSVLATDACLEGAGGVNLVRREFFHFVFPDWVLAQQHHINVLELVVLTVAVKLWGEDLLGMKVQVKCDNEATVSVVNTGRSRDPVMLAWLRELAFESAKSQCHVRAVHIAGSENRLPDLLSRWHLSRDSESKFRELAQGEWVERPVEEGLLVLKGDW